MIDEIQNITINVASCEEYPSDSMKEKYSLSKMDDPGNGKINIAADAEWGVLHALETLSQLLHPIRNQLSFNNTQVEDFPRFGYRGLLIDTSRHFLPVSMIKATISAMSWNKMNVLHWHIVDLDSFPYQSKALPLLSALGSYTEFNHIYSQKDINDIIEYGRYRGVRIVPEFDTPGHTLSWGPGAGEGFLTQCYNHDHKPIDGEFGPIDPTQKRNYDLMTTLFTELSTVFSDKFLHLGGDEVPFGCWQSNPAIVEYMKKNDIRTFGDLESLWVQGVIDIAESLDLDYVVWEEVFSNGVKVRLQ